MWVKGGSAGRGVGEMIRKPAQLHASDHSNDTGDEEEVIKEVLIGLGGPPRMRRGLQYPCACGDEAASSWLTSRRRAPKRGSLHRSTKSLEETSPGVAKDLLD